MKIDPSEVSAKEMYMTMTQAITPRPIAWVSTVSPAGVNNLAPFSYFNAVCSQPAVLSFSVVNQSDGSPKDTVRNIRANEQFVVNLVPFDLGESMVKTATELPYEESEIELAGLKTIHSTKVAPPRIVGTPIQFECSLFRVIEIGQGPTAANLILGEVQLIHIDDAVLNEESAIDPGLVDLVGRMGGRDYCRTQDRFSLP